jgi:hypothetical protein
MSAPIQRIDVMATVLAKRRQLKEVAAALNEALHRRDNDVDGYWAIGVLCRHAQVHGVASVRLDLISQTMQPEDSRFAMLLAGYHASLRRRLSQRGLSVQWVSAACVEIAFDREDPTQGRALTRGKYYELTVTIIDDTQRRRWIKCSGHCAPHDSTMEHRSNRPELTRALSLQVDAATAVAGQIPDPSLPDLLKFSDQFDPVKALSALRATQDRSTGLKLWRGLQYAFSSGESFDVSKAELLQCMAYGAKVAPYLGTPALRIHDLLKKLFIELQGPMIELAERLRGREALLVEPSVVARVRIKSATITNDLLTITLEVLPSPGLGNAGSSVQRSAHRGVLLASKCYVSASHVDWRLLLDQTVIARIEHIVKALPEGVAYHDDFSSRAAPSGSRFKTVQEPGTVARALRNYIEGQETLELGRVRPLSLPRAVVPIL